MYRPVTGGLKTILIAAVIGTSVVFTAAQAISEPVGDPTAPYRGHKAGGTKVSTERNRSLALTAIIYSSGERYALINGTSFAPGDMIGGWEIQEIRPETVVLNRSGRKSTLTLESKDIRVTPVDFYKGKAMP